MIPGLLKKLNKKTQNNTLTIDSAIFLGSCFDVLFFLLSTKQMEIALEGQIQLVENVIKIKGKTTVCGFETTIEIDLYQDDSGVIQYTLSGTISDLSLKSLANAIVVNGYVPDVGIPANLPGFTFENISISSDSNSQTFSLDVETSANKWGILSDLGIS